MNPNLFFKNFELLADAPNGVQKLRELILQLAVMGKLVEQDPKDEPASVLVEKIIKERDRLVKEKKIKKEKTSQLIDIEDLPFKCPEGWVWEKINNICFVTKLAGFEFTKYIQLSDFGEVPVIRAQNVKINGINKNNLKYIDLNTSLILERSSLTKPSILMTFIGAGIGDVAIFDDCKRWHLGPNVAKLEPFNNFNEKIEIKFLLLYLMSESGRSEIFKYRKSTAQPSLSMETIRDIKVPLPPLAEQKRIVSKVDELITLCDKLEARHKKRQELQSKLNSAVLDIMLSIENQEEFEQHWLHICENFDLLYDKPENVEKLRQAILQLAVQGKLVEQNPEDEPARALIEKIEKEKGDLVNKRKISESQSAFQIVSEDEKEVPSGWENLVLGSCIELISGQHLGADEQNDAELGLPYLTGPADFGKLYPTATRWTEKPKALSRKDDILITVKGAGVGKTNILSLDEAVIGRQLMAIRPICLDYKFVYLLILASYNKFQELSIGLTVPGISREDILNFQLGLPPLAEQKRIVEKVEQLMGLCDELEAKLRKEREESEKLMETVVKGLLESAVAGKSESDKLTLMQAAVIQSK